MIRTDESRRDFEEPTTTDAGCAGFDTEGGHVLYDPENGAAWLRSDTVLDPAEVR